MLRQRNEEKKSSQQMISKWKKMSINFYLTVYRKINLKYRLKWQGITLLGENIGQTLLQL